MDCSRVKNEIINFVLNSPEEVNSKAAVFIAGIFIAGMQAQKNLMSYGRYAVIEKSRRIWRILERQVRLAGL